MTAVTFLLCLICVVFQLTSSRRGWQYVFSVCLAHNHFNSHPHEEDDRPEFFELVDDLDFNSHPHEEDDLCFLVVLLKYKQFQLTSSRRGWRIYASAEHSNTDISTHILTKRMTGISWYKNGGILFQLTSSRRGWLRTITLMSTG